MSKTEKTTSIKSTRSILIYATPTPERYASLKEFCIKKGYLSYNTYSRKTFPFKYNGYFLYKISLESGIFDECVFDIVMDQFKSLEGVGCITNQKPHSVSIENNFIKSLGLNAHFDGKKYQIKGINLKMKNPLNGQKK